MLIFRYNTLPVEFSDKLGTTENLDAMVDDGHLYVNANSLEKGLGIRLKQAMSMWLFQQRI